jgi:hypothetical protein
MEEFTRLELKNDPELRPLFDMIKGRHEVAEHTIKVLVKNKHIKDFCEEARHFVFLPGKGSNLFIHYDVSSWYHPKGIQVKIESIGVYDDFMEYEKARVSQLHGAESKDIPNIN